MIKIYEKPRHAKDITIISKLTNISIAADTFKLSCIITYKRPGVSFSINSFVASGVTSREVKPVPP